MVSNPKTQRGGSNPDPFNQLNSLHQVAKVREGDQAGVEGFEEELEGVNNSWAGAVEELVAVEGEDFGVADGAEAAPAGELLEGFGAGDGVRQGETAGHQEDVVGVSGFELVESDDGGRFAGCSEYVLATGHFDEFRDPMAGIHERIEPLDAGHRRALLHHAGFFEDIDDAVLELGEEFFSFVRFVGEFCDCANVVPNAGKGVCFQREDLGAEAMLLQKGADLFLVDRADGAGVLGDDSGGLELSHLFFAQFDNPAAILLAGARADGEVDYFGRVIANVGAAHELGQRTKSGEDFGRGGEEGDDAGLRGCCHARGLERPSPCPLPIPLSGIGRGGAGRIACPTWRAFAKLP